MLGAFEVDDLKVEGLDDPKIIWLAEDDFEHDSTQRPDDFLA